MLPNLACWSKFCLVIFVNSQIIVDKVCDEDKWFELKKFDETERLAKNFLMHTHEFLWGSGNEYNLWCAKRLLVPATYMIWETASTNPKQVRNSFLSCLSIMFSVQTVEYPSLCSNNITLFGSNLNLWQGVRKKFQKSYNLVLKGSFVIIRLWMSDQTT